MSNNLIKLQTMVPVVENTQGAELRVGYLSSKEHWMH